MTGRCLASFGVSPILVSTCDDAYIRSTIEVPPVSSW